ncbi:MAG TPA: bifunctional diguanylate cyclase/phosphodiesterase [Rhizomicrobium sp.]
MLKRLLIVLAWLFAAALPAVAQAATPSPASLEKSAQTVDFADRKPVLDLVDALKPYRGPAPAETDGSVWYVLTISNSATVPTTRILLAPEPPAAPLRVLPVSSRPRIRQIVASDPGIAIVDASAFVRHSFEITIPPSASVALALHIQNAARPPVVLAWTEAALSSQHRRLSIFIAAVVGLIAAAMLITGGLAVMTGHAAPRWAALALFALVLARLSGTGLFDTSVVTSVGGPYGLTAMLAGFALAAGFCLIDTVVPFSMTWPGSERYVHWTLYGIIALSLASYLGVPAATLVTEALLLFGTSAGAAYLVHRGREGDRPARVLAPAATIFALVALATAVATVGGFADNFAAPATVAGFSAAGALLLALAIVAGEGLVTVSHWRLALANLNHHAPAHASPQTASALAAIGASHQGVFDLDFQKNVVNLSAEAAALIGFKAAPRRFKRAAWLARIHPEDRDVYVQAIGEFSQRIDLAFRIEFRVESEAGHYPWFELRATMLGEAPPAARCLGLLADISARKDADAIPVPVLRDPLTGLGNRVALEQAIAGLGERLPRASLALLDVDRFKAIHASLGDAGADAILVEIARRLTAGFGARAQVFRLGGDAFAVLFGDADIMAAGAELIAAAKPVHMVEGREVFAPASVGLASGQGIAAPADLLKNAEQALAEAKRHGGGVAKIHSGELAAAAPDDSVVLETELRRALDEDQLDVFYQPIVRLSDRSVVGFEALLRWHHPEKGLVVPSDFIAHSEETGLIVPLGRFALERAAKALADWQRFFPLDPPLFVSVNLSRGQLRDRAFEGVLRATLSRERIAPGTLKLELTESVAATAEDVRPILQRLHELGVGIAIDDFGTGMSNFSQLKELPFDTLKIDRSFLARLNGQEDSQEAVVLRSIVTLAHDLGRDVVVEGVENDHDALWVKGLGCDYAQGFCFSQALPASEALNYLAMHFDERTAVPERSALS